MTKKYKEIKPLVIGIGVAGKRHLEAQLNLGIKTGIYSTNFQTKKLYKNNSNVIVFNNLEEGIDWSNLVHICTPDNKHTEYVVAAIKKRKAILCEKSFTTSLSDALYLQKLAHQSKLIVLIGQNYRLTPTFVETRKRVLEGQIGTITHIETTYYHDKNEYQQRYEDKYFLYIGGSHAVDLACWVIDEQITNVETVSENDLNYQISVKFSSGLMGIIKLDASSLQPRNGSNLKALGDKGKLVSHNKIDKLLFYEKGNRKPQMFQFPNTTTHTTALEVKIIDDYLLGRRNSYWPIPSVDEAINTIKILDRIDRLY